VRTVMVSKCPKIQKIASKSNPDTLVYDRMLLGRSLLTFWMFTYTYRSAACVHCKSLKVRSPIYFRGPPVLIRFLTALQVRCEFSPGESICQRCLAGNHDCVPRGRKKRKAAPYAKAIHDSFSLFFDRKMQDP
jgi:hypothetical protein